MIAIDFVWVGLILLIGSLTGFLSGFLGIGGGFVLVPLLISIGIPAHEAIGSSLAYIALIGIVGSRQHYAQKNCNIKLALYMLCGGVITAQIGAITTLYLNEYTLEILLMVILLGTAIRMMLMKDEVIGVYHERSINVPLTILTGSVVGFLSGLLGVGGGFILIPLMVLVLKVPIHIAVGTSLLEVMGLAASGALRHYMMGNINLLLVGILVLGGVVSTPLGAVATKRVSAKHLRYIFCIVLFLFSFRLLISIVFSI